MGDAGNSFAVKLLKSRSPEYLGEIYDKLTVGFSNRLAGRPIAFTNWPPKNAFVMDPISTRGYFASITLPEPADEQFIESWSLPGDILCIRASVYRASFSIFDNRLDETTPADG
jgi:hypothetical protein